MEPANKPPVKRGDETRLDFLPDADAIERSPLPSYLRITVHLLAGLLLVFLVWASVSKVEKIVTAPGRLVNPLPNIVVQPLETSIVQTVEVRAGQLVKKGQVLATLDPTFTQADEAQLRSRLASLENQEKGLRAELTGKAAAGGKLESADDILQAQLSGERQANFEAQKARLDQNIERLKASIETNRRDQQVLAQRLKSLSEIEAMQEKLLAENFGAKMHLLEARDRRLEVERTLVNARNRDIEQARELAAAEAERAAFNKGWRQKSMEELLNATRERDSIKEQLAKADKRHQMVQVTAPADGIVLEVGKLSPGTIVREAEQMFVLVPLSAQMEAEVTIEAADIGAIKAGDNVHLKLDAFPFQMHGMLEGRLRTVSQDAFKREQSDGGRSSSYYVARATINAEPKLRNLKPESRLLPGMTIQAEIVVGKRSVISYLLWPLTKALDESIREP
ncbi:HlyD family type I secretion periplasmic adaptor subunit [Pseudoduganella sp.]|uniref:HlyD family type I secretion periplasmic adaptor subunit n=1 Tax=Pseudoduganella sp. TaxID=1880898 RepID=UPI0035B2006D